jgi:hypothetical protein
MSWGSSGNSVLATARRPEVSHSHPGPWVLMIEREPLMYATQFCTRFARADFWPSIERAEE